MSFAREGLGLIAIAAGLAALAFLVAILRRSWSWWLLAISLLVVTLLVAYFHREPARSRSPNAMTDASASLHRTAARRSRA